MASLKWEICVTLYRITLKLQKNKAMLLNASHKSCAWPALCLEGRLAEYQRSVFQTHLLFHPGDTYKDETEISQIIPLFF